MILLRKKILPSLNLFKNNVRKSAFIVLIMLFGVQIGFTQKSKTKKRKKKDKIEIYQNIYVGAFIESPLYIANSLERKLGFGLSPFVGIEFFDFLSFGPKFYFYRLNIRRPSSSITLVNRGGGAFVRAKVFERFYGQVEGNLNYFNVENPNSTNGKSFVSLPTAFIGIGYSTGSILEFEIYLGYEFTGNYDRNLISPFEYRTGFTYSF